jgi:hypothetical protein
MSSTGLNRRHAPAAALAAGGLLFALGLALARARVPEWRLGPLPDQRTLGRELQDFAARCGLRLVGETPRVTLCERSLRQRVMQELPLTSAVSGAVLAIRVDQDAMAAPAGTTHGLQALKVWFDPAGRPQEADLRPSGASAALAALGLSRRAPARRPEILGQALVAPGETLGRPVQMFLLGLPVFLFPLAGSAPPHHITAAEVIAGLQASRNRGDVESAVSRWGGVDLFTGWHDVAPMRLVLALIAAVFCVLAIRRRLGLANAGWLAALASAAVLPDTLRQPSFEAVAEAVGGVVAQGLWLAVLWSAAESLWRTAGPRIDTTLDVLRARRLTAQAGGALLSGFGLGAAAAGLSLAAYALVTYLPSASAHALSVALPVVDAAGGPLAAGITAAAVIAFLLSAGRRFSGRPWIAVAAALVSAYALAPVKLEPWPLALASNVLVAGVLVAAGELGGLTTLLAASLAYWLLPAAAFSALHLSWLPGSFALAAGSSGILLVAGLAGVIRPRAEAEGAAPPPAFIRRLEQERRREVEMELLARMQRGLLPSRLPAIPGWEIAACSLLADRAGGDLYDFVNDPAGLLWIAAGDVAGHGYSCAIDQAMVKAALASLIGERRTPSEILAETDRVLRTTAASRSFTSLALLRLDPATGEALLANAGHPFPLLVTAGHPASELALPGLPLGQGPPRRYADMRFELAPGDTLVICSDGLFEAGAAGRESGAQYGYQRPRLVLDELANRPAAEVLDGLLADWRRHRGSGAPADDTTVVVLRRLPTHAAPPIG